MPLRFALIFAATLAFGCGGSVHRAELYNDYAVLMAQRGLWQEAAMRWEQATALSDDAKLWNNLGVAYEAGERFDDALTAYARATALEPGNSHYMRNLRRAERNKTRAEEAPPRDPNELNEDEMEELELLDETERRPDARPY